jgi:hypothetical protein
MDDATRVHLRCTCCQPQSIVVDAHAIDVTVDRWLRAHRQTGCMPEATWQFSDVDGWLRSVCADIDRRIEARHV